MVKHTQTIRLSVFDHFAGLALKEFKVKRPTKLNKLTLITRTFFSIFPRITGNYVAEQTSTFRRQKCDLVHLKFSARLNDFSPSF